MYAKNDYDFAEVEALLLQVCIDRKKNEQKRLTINSYNISLLTSDIELEKREL